MKLRSGLIGFGLAIVLVAGCSGSDAADVEATTATEPAPSSITAPATPTDAVATSVTAPPTVDSQANSAVETDDSTDVGEAFVDAFYAFDTATLSDLLTESDSDRLMLFNQGWAQGANYAVVERSPCETVTTTEIRCSITYEDDFIRALGIDSNATDTFDITLDQSGAIVTVSLSSDVPPEVPPAVDAVFVAQPQLIESECQGLFDVDGGPTPAECARAVVAGVEASAE